MELEKENRTEKDRISSLPDEILGHILSFLPTVTAVSTSILSTRWKNVWNFVSCFDFKLEFGWAENEDEVIIRKLNFEKFVDTVLIRHSYQFIEKFRLCLRAYNENQLGSFSNLSTWICAAIRNNVEEIDLTIDRVIFEIPGILWRLLFSCETLRILVLDGNYDLEISESVWLPSLKVLRLKNFESLTNGVIEKLLSRCPVIEEFLIDIDYTSEKLTTLCVRSSSLKRLMISNVGNLECRVSIDAPNLKFLERTIFGVELFETVKLSSLVEATIYATEYEYDDYHMHRLYQAQVVQFLRQISNVKTLTIDGYMLKEINFRDADLSYPYYHNLRHLVVDFDRYSYGVTSDLWHGLLGMLNCSPNLDFLTLEMNYFHGIYPDQSFWEKTEPFLSSIKTLEFCGFDGGEDHIKMIKHFLMIAKRLEKLKITLISKSYYKITTSSKEQVKILKKLLTLPRASRKCEVIFA